MLYKISLILKYFLYTSDGFFRKSYLFQMITIYIGSLIISLTLSIMDGMEDEIFNKITAFNYRYKSNNNIKEYDNFGISEIARLKFKESEIMVQVSGYRKFLLYRDRIKQHIIKTTEDTFNSSEMLIIGESFSKYYNIEIGDTLKIEDIVNINIVSGQCESKDFIVSDIYNFSFLNYDMNNVFIEDTNTFFSESNINYYYDSQSSPIDSPDIVEKSFDKYSDLFAAIDFEKKLYMLVGIIGIFISSIIIFNNTILVLLEKTKQFHLLSLLGFNRGFFTSLCIFSNLIVSVLFSSLGLLSTFFIYALNNAYNIFDTIFIYTPFDKLPILLSFNNFFLTFSLVIIISFVSTYLSVVNMKNQIFTKTL